MSFGIAKDVRSEVRVCTPDLLNEAIDAPQVAKVCAEIEDALEALHRGELTQDEFETIKSTLKKKLPVALFHASFKNGRRKNEDAIPSGLSIYDLDHIPNPRAKWAEIEARKEELGILLAHVSPSLEGLRLVFIMPQGMDLAQSQAWMAQQLGDDKYDACVKDFARCSFLVPREYVLWMDAEKLFLPHNENIDIHHVVHDEKNHVVHDANHVVHDYPSTYEDVPYETIVETLEEQMGGQPEHGSRNNFIFSMACHLRYVTNDDALAHFGLFNFSLQAFPSGGPAIF